MKKVFFNLFIILSLLIGFISCKANTVDVYYTVTFVTDIGETPEAIKVKEGETLAGTQLPDLSYDNYTFEGWYTGEYKDDSSIISAGNFIVLQDVTLTAKWSTVKCIVTYTPPENSDEDSITQYYDYNQTYTLIDNPYEVKTGYVFKGWKCNEELYQPQNQMVALEKIITYTAVIQTQNENPYTIVYKNILETDKTVNGTNPLVFNFSDKVFIYDMERAGYIFEGWFTDENLTIKAVINWQPTKAPLLEGQTVLTYYAKWIPIKYTVVFDSNGGNGKIEKIECEYDKEFNLPQNTFTLKDNDFLGWSSTKVKQEDTKNYKEKDLVKNLTTKNNDVVTLYASWKDLTIPDAPANLSVYKRDATSLELKYTNSSVFDFAGTYIYVYEGNDVKPEKLVKREVVSKYDFNAGETALYTVSELKSNTEYTFELVTYDLADNKSFDNNPVVTEKTRTAICQGVKNIDYQIIDNKIHFTWEYPSTEECPDFEKLVIEVRTSEEENYTEVTTITDKNTVEYDYTIIQQDSLCYFKFTLYESKDISGASRNAEVSKDVVVELQIVVPYIYLVANSEDSVTLKWINPAPYESLFDEYVIEYSDGSNKDSIKASKDVISTKIENLSAASLYTFTIHCEKTINGITINSSETTTIGSTSTYEQNNKIAFLGSIYYTDKSYSINYDDSKTPAGIVVKVDENNKPVHIVSAKDLDSNYYWDNSTSNHPTVYLSGVTDGYSSGEYIDNIYSNIETKITGSNLSKYSVSVPFMKKTKEWEEGGITNWFVPMENEFKAVVDKKMLYNDALERCEGTLLFADNKNYYICKFTNSYAWYIDNQGVIYMTPTGFTVQYQSMNNVIVRPFAKVN